MEERNHKMKLRYGLFSMLLTLSSVESAAVPYKGFKDWLTSGQSLPLKLIQSLSEPVPKSFSESYLGFGSRTCPASTESFQGKSVDTVFQEARSLESSGSYCEAAAAYLGIRTIKAFDPFWTDAGIRAVISYIKAGDHLEAINEANDILDVVQNLPIQHENVHMLALVTVYQKMREHDANHSQEWTRYLLGIEGQQSSGNTYLNRLSLRSFEKNFPQSRYLPTLDSWKQEARDLYGRHYLETGKYHQEEENHLSAILSFQNILRAGPVIKVFPEAAYETIRSYLLFSKAILYSNRISNQELRDWMRLPDDKPLDRAAIGRQTYQEGEKIYKLMKQNLPNDSYTQKAAGLFNAK